MRVREYPNSNGTTLITLSTLKDCNNKSINFLVDKEEKKEVEKLNLEIIDDDFVEDINNRFGFSISLNNLTTELSNKARVQN